MKLTNENRKYTDATASCAMRNTKHSVVQSRDLFANFTQPIRAEIAARAQNILRGNRARALPVEASVFRESKKETFVVCLYLMHRDLSTAIIM